MLLSPEHVGSDVRIKERDSIQKILLRNVSPYGQLPGPSRRLNPHPVVLPKQFMERLENFHEALALALDNIIERWWNDTEADFPARMPLEPWAEALLQWINKGSNEGILRSYKDHQGNLRPDILIPETEDKDNLQFQVCEINGRFPISFLHYVASAYEALAGLQWPSSLLKPATDHNRLFDSLFKLFDPGYPIHFVGKNSDFPKDSPLFGLIEQRTGMRPRCVDPSSLRLVPSDTSPTGFILACILGLDPAVATSPSSLLSVRGESLEEVHQVGLQLYDYELAELDPAMVLHIAKHSVSM